MKLDLDILQSVLRAFTTRDPELLVQYNEVDTNRQRELLICEGFAEGNGIAHDPPNGKPFAWDYSLSCLTPSGQHLLALSSDKATWERAKQAGKFRKPSWSLPELYSYLQTQSAGGQIG